ncbi:MAG: twin arginine-targeting protein translocase TatB [Rhodocyclales bacterium GWA2_65_20]|nr:MAG: twin arginine-targeting protein translocase TatB [Rhodocyclales bacterium GWA2_65_20]
MFDVAFSELVLIALVALVVIGPERLPKVARMAGHLLGRLQRYVSDVKADINREIQLEELKKVQDEVVSQVRNMEQSVAEQMKTVETDLNQSIALGIEEKAAAAAPQPEAAAPATIALPEIQPAALEAGAAVAGKPHA